MKTKIDINLNFRLLNKQKYIVYDLINEYEDKNEDIAEALTCLYQMIDHIQKKAAEIHGDKNVFIEDD